MFDKTRCSTFSALAARGFFFPNSKKFAAKLLKSFIKPCAWVISS